MDILTKARGGKNLNTLVNNRKFLSAVVIGVTLVCSYICYSVGKPNGYEICVGGTPIAYVEDIATFNNVKNDVEKTLEKRFGNTKIIGNITEDEIIIDKNLFTSQNDIKHKLLVLSNREVTAFAMLSDNKEIALVANEAEGKAVQEYIKNYYISKANIKNIKETRVKNKIAYAMKKVNLLKVQDVEQAAVNIINTNYKSETPILTVEFKGDIQEKQVAAAATMTNWSNDILQGETKVQKEGKDGTKIVNKQITVENRTAISEAIIGESIVEKPENKIVLKGLKSPTASVVAVIPTSRGMITSSFGERWGKNHNGVDIGAPSGTPIYALKEGLVSYASWEEGYGKCIKIEHDGKLETIYGHCSAIEVKVGQKIKGGQEIGKVGSTGRSTGPHLHFEVRLAGVPVEPTQYLRR